MIITLPTIKKTFKDGKIISENGEIQVSINTSFLAHLKWEEQFQSVIGCDLNTYTERIRHLIKDAEKSKAQMLSMLKMLYCYIDSEKLPTFRHFCELFDFEIADEILQRIAVVLEEVGKSASKN